MKKVLLSIGLSSIVLASMAPLASAETKSATSNGKVGFVVDEEGITPPVNPTDPTDPTDPELPVGPGTTGALRLDRVSNIDFGNNNKLSATAQNYYGLFETDTADKTKQYPTSIQITDARGADHLGWKLEVKNDGVFTNENSKKITGAQISLSSLEVKGFSNQEPGMYPTLTATSQMISTGQEVALLSAADTPNSGSGTGIWTMHAGSIETKTSGQGLDGTGTTGAVDDTKKDRNPAVKLMIPKGQIIQEDTTYKTDLVWSLTDAP